MAQLQKQAKPEDSCSAPKWRIDAAWHHFASAAVERFGGCSCCCASTCEGFRPIRVRWKARGSGSGFAIPSDAMDQFALLSCVKGESFDQWPGGLAVIVTSEQGGGPAKFFRFDLVVVMGTGLCLASHSGIR
jgi:hypothetical protein